MSTWEIVGIVLLVVLALEFLPMLLGLIVLVLVWLIAMTASAGARLMNRVWGMDSEREGES